MRRVFVDGFTDFTTTQLQMLHSLAQRVQETVISLTTDPAEGRAELFAAPRRLLERMHAIVGQGRCESCLAEMTARRPCGTCSTGCLSWRASPSDSRATYQHPRRTGSAG